MLDSMQHNYMQLEKERCALVEEVAGLKANLADAEKLQVESDKRYQVLSERYHLETQTLKGQVENVGVFSSVMNIGGGGGSGDV